MENFKDGLIMVLAGIGISISPHMYFGGLFLAFGAHFLFRAYSFERVNASRTLGAMTTFILSTLFAIISTMVAPDMPVQLAMGISGFFSVPLVRKLARRSEELSDRAIDKVTGKRNN